MQPLNVVWIYGSSSPENPQHFDTIAQWWGALAGQPITWRQRLADGVADPQRLDWEVERFDEEFVLDRPTVRGISFYWYKDGSEPERSTTPQRLVLDTIHQQLYISPQSQPDLVIRVGRPEAIYQTLELRNPETAVAIAQGACVVTLTDPVQELTVKVSLNAETLYQLKRQLP